MSGSKRELASIPSSRGLRAIVRVAAHSPVAVSRLGSKPADRPGAGRGGRAASHVRSLSHGQRTTLGADVFISVRGWPRFCLSTSRAAYFLHRENVLGFP